MSDTATTAAFPADPVPPLDPPLDPRRPRGGRPPGAKTDPRKLQAARNAAAARKERSRAAAAAARAAAGSEAPADPVGRIVNPTPTRSAKMAAQSDVLAEQLAAVYELVGAALETGSMIAPRAGWWFARVGGAFKTNADRCARSIVDYSETNARVRRFLESAGGTAGLLSIVLAHAAILMAAISRRPVDGADDTLPSFDGLDMEKLGDLAAQMFPGMFPAGDPGPAAPVVDDAAA